MQRIIVYGLVLIAVMATIKSQRVLQRTHLVGACSTLVQAADGSEWRSCVPGRLSGRPGLRFDSCTDWGLHGNAEIWNCPAQLDNTYRRE